MKKAEIRQGIEAEDELLSEDDGQEHLSPASSFRTVSSSFSSSLSSSAASSPRYPPSLTLTPLDRRAIGRDIEERPSFSWLPSSYEEFYGYGHQLPTVTSGTRVEQGAAATHLLADIAAARTGDAANLHPQPPKMRIEYRISPWKTSMDSVMKTTSRFKGVESCTLDTSSETLIIIGVGVDPLRLLKKLRKKSVAEMISVRHEPAEQQSHQ